MDGNAVNNSEASTINICPSSSKSKAASQHTLMENDGGGGTSSTVSSDTTTASSSMTIASALDSTRTTIATSFSNSCEVNNDTSDAANVCISGDGGNGDVGEQFLQLAKSAKGPAAVQLIKEALEAPGLYVFAELLQMPNIAQLAENPSQLPYYRLVEVFAYGVYSDYLQLASSLPPLSPTMQTKLRHLSIVTMAADTKTLPLDTLVQKLDLSNRRELEDLIIEAIYADVLHGKLDQKAGVLEVDYAIGRDIKPEDLPHIISTLQEWCDSCTGLLSTLDALVSSANSAKEASLRRGQNIEAEVVKIKSNLKRQLGGEGGAAAAAAAAADDGIGGGSSGGDHVREAERKLHRLKKGATSAAAGSSGGAGAKPTAKFWPKS